MLPFLSQEFPPVVESIAETVPAADEAPVEEEFDLSDIMSEEVEDAGTSKEARMREIEEQLKKEEEERAASAATASSKKSSKKKNKKKSKSKAKSEL